MTDLSLNDKYSKQIRVLRVLVKEWFLFWPVTLQSYQSGAECLIDLCKSSRLRFNVWHLLKDHTYLNKFAAESCRFV